MIGIDFTERSLSAARWVAMHLAPEAELVLVHVLRRPEAPAFLYPLLEPMCGVVSEVAPALYESLRHVAEQLGAERTSLDMRDGSRAEALAGAAEERGADLICIGGMRHRRGGARFGANLPLRVMARSRLPLLVVPPGGLAQSGRHVLAAIDDRPDDAVVLQTAVGASAAPGARLDVVHVLSPELHLFVRAVRPEEHDAAHSVRGLELIASPARHRIRDEAHLLRLAHAWIERQLDAAGAAGGGVADTGTHVRVGDPGQEIVRLARARHADLIVIGRGGPALDATAGAARLPVGSSARLVSWAAPCPVLVLAPQPAPRAPTPGPRGRSRMRRPDVTDRIAVSTVASRGFPPAASRTVADKSSLEDINRVAQAGRRRG